MVAFHLRDAKNKLRPRNRGEDFGRAGSAVFPSGILPPKERSKLGRRRGVGREKGAHSPPGSAVVEETDGEYGVHEMGTPVGGI